MDRQLMAPEDLDTMGFGAGTDVTPIPEGKPQPDGQPEEIVAGLAAARKAKGGIFGIALPMSGKEAPSRIGGGLGGHGGMKGGS